MTSPREAVSILTAAALVVAPVGGVAATYTTGYADNGDGHTVKDDRDHDIPANYEEALVWIKEGKTLYKSCVDYMAGHADKFGGLTEAQRAELWSLAVDDEPTVPESEMTAVSEPEPEPVPAPVETTPESEEPRNCPLRSLKRRMWRSRSFPRCRLIRTIQRIRLLLSTRPIPLILRSLPILLSP